MEKTKILFTDLDGTLLNSQKKISKNVFDKITEMTNLGHKFVLASGRSFDSILHVRDMLGLTQEGVYITAYNGALLYDCAAGKLLEEYRMTLNDAQTLYDLAHQEHIHAHTYTDTHILTHATSKELDFYRIHIHQPYLITDHLSDYLTQGPHKVLVINLDNKSTLEDFRAKIANHPLSANIESTFSNSKYLEFYSKHAGKGNGLIHLCQLLNIPIENSYAMGDEENDISMIKAAGTGIAMANATALVKASADYTTQQDNDHDAMAEVIDRFICN